MDPHVKNAELEVKNAQLVAKIAGLNAENHALKDKYLALLLRIQELERLKADEASGADEVSGDDEVPEPTGPFVAREAQEFIDRCWENYLKGLDSSKRLAYELAVEGYQGVPCFVQKFENGAKLILGSVYNLLDADFCEKLISESGSGNLRIVNVANGEFPSLIGDDNYTNVSVTLADWCDDGEFKMTEKDLDIISGWIHYSISKGDTVFVHCVEGKSRSATAILAYMWKYHEWTFAHTLKEIRKVRTFGGAQRVEPNVTFKKVLNEWASGAGGFDDGADAIEVAAGGAGGAGVEHELPSNWTCLACTVENANSNPICVVCGAKKGSTEHDPKVGGSTSNR